MAEILHRSKVRMDKEGRITLPVEVRRREKFEGKPGVFDLWYSDDGEVRMKKAKE